MGFCKCLNCCKCWETESGCLISSLFLWIVFFIPFKNVFQHLIVQKLRKERVYRKKKKVWWDSIVDFMWCLQTLNQNLNTLMRLWSCTGPIWLLLASGVGLWEVRGGAVDNYVSGKVPQFMSQCVGLCWCFLCNGFRLWSRNLVQLWLRVLFIGKGGLIIADKYVILK